MSEISVIKSAKSVEDAVKAALLDLGVAESDVIIEVLEEGKKGIFGLGGKDAVVKVEVIKVEKTKEEIAKDFLQDVFDKMGVKAEAVVSLSGDTMNINVEGENLGILIGKRGQVLDSLQYLVSLVVNKDSEDDYIRIVLDTENYRKKRKDTLEKLANNLAHKAKRMRKDIVLEPMNPFERRIIHAALQNHPHVSTRSEGDEPYRKVIIFLNR